MSFELPMRIGSDSVTICCEDRDQATRVMQEIRTLYAEQEANVTRLREILTNVEQMNSAADVEVAALRLKNEVLDTALRGRDMAPVVNDEQEPTD